MLNEIDRTDATPDYEERRAADKTLQHEIIMDLLVTVSGFGAVVTLVLLLVHSLMLS